MRFLLGALLTLALAAPARAQDAPAEPRTAVYALGATGERDPEELGEHAPAALSRCERHARATGERARVTIRVEVDRSGRVRDVRTLPGSPTPRSDAWLRCVMRTLSSLRFAAGGAGTIDAVVDWVDDPSDPAPLPGPPPPPIPAAPPHQHRPLARPEPREPAPELSRDTIRAHIRERVPAIQRCYARTPDARPGRIRIELSIDPDGTVHAVRTLADEIGSPTLDACVRYQVRTMRFPEHGGPPIVVAYTFALGSS